jgi:uncharacterized membrane protein YczE
MTLYFTGATLVFGILLNAFLKDTTTPKNHVTSWIFLAVAAILWPIAFPSMLRKRLQRTEVLNLDYLN